jgi:hypothetical protein
MMKSSHQAQHIGSRWRVNISKNQHRLLEGTAIKMGCSVLLQPIFYDVQAST